MNIVEHAAVESGHPCAVFSLEMSRKLLVQRLITSRARVSMARFLAGDLNRQEQAAIARACNDFGRSAIEIDETTGLKILDFRAKARRLKKEKGIRLIAIDYLQLMSADSKKARDNRQIEISEISAGIKGIAKEMDIPIIVLAQLNRQVEHRKGTRPMLSDLRESGSIEQDADLVAFLTRTGYAGGPVDEAEEDGKAELLIAKNRNGPTGEVPLRFRAEWMRFEEAGFQ
jgi:replicative DNA helicase